MKTIKIAFLGFWKGFSEENNLFTNILKEKYNVEISSTPDVLFASPLGKPFEYLKYDCVRILFTGEPLVPDFNVFDYAIGFDYLDFPDHLIGKRYYRFPLCFYNIDGVRRNTQALSYDDAFRELKNKTCFCNFIYGHRSAFGEREELLREIERYKHVDSAGSFMNNMKDSVVVPYSKKIEFIRQYKFTIACESISYPGFTTEKLMNPFFANSIPIYYGNPLVEKEFNINSFVRISQIDNIESAINRIRELDENDDLYIEALTKNKLSQADYAEKLYSGLKEFLWAIFSQDKSSCYRRMPFYIQKQHEDYLKEYMRFSDSLGYKLYKKSMIR